MYIRIVQNGSDDKINVSEKSDFYRNVAEYLQALKSEKAITVKAIADDGEVIYRVTPRLGFISIVEVKNTLPDQYLPNTEDYYGTYVNAETNAYRSYEMRISGGSVRASFGRMATDAGEEFGAKTKVFPLSRYWIKKYENEARGFTDRSKEYFDRSEIKMPEFVHADTPECELFEALLADAAGTVRKAKVMVPLTPALITKASECIERMRSIAADKELDNELKVRAFNQARLEIIALLQRPIVCGNVNGVGETLAKSVKDFGYIIQSEEDLLNAMAGTVSGYQAAANRASFDAFGIDVFEATDRQKKRVLAHLSDQLKSKVKKIYRVIPRKQADVFNGYLKANDIDKVKLLWHGSRNENWLSIAKTSLQLNPNAIITGKMFGDGIYFAPSSMKSWGYTSYSGSHWASGSSDHAYMGLYAVAYGKPYDVYSWSHEDYKKSVENGPYNSLHAHAGQSLRNDEIIVYREEAVLLNYIVQFG